MIRRYKWSFISLAITVGVLAFTIAVGEYEYRVHGIQDISWLSPLGALTILASLTAALIGFYRERSILSVIALLLGLANFFFYVV